MASFNSLREAAKYARVSQQSMLMWTDKYDIGEREGSRWKIDKEKLDRVISTRDQIAELWESIKRRA